MIRKDLRKISAKDEERSERLQHLENLLSGLAENYSSLAKRTESLETLLMDHFGERRPKLRTQKTLL